MTRTPAPATGSFPAPVRFSPSVFAGTAWQELQDVLIERRVAPEGRYRDASLTDWVDAVFKQKRSQAAKRRLRSRKALARDMAVGAIVVRCGVLVEDLRWLATADGGLDAARDPGGAAIRLHCVVIDLARECPEPQMTIRDALGWLMAHCVPGRSYRDAQDTLAAWVEAGLSGTDWLWFAAGFTAEQTVVHKRAQSVDDERLMLMAALRGVHLPAS